MASNYEDPFWKPYERSEKSHISTTGLGACVGTSFPLLKNKPRDADGLKKFVIKINASSGTGKDGREKAPNAVASTDNFEMLRDAIASTDNFEMSWGDGLQTRSFSPVDDCCLRMASNYEDPYWEPYARPEKIHISTPGLGAYIGTYLVHSLESQGLNIASYQWKKKKHTSEDMFCDRSEPNVSLKEAYAKLAKPRDAYGLEKFVKNIYVSSGTGKDGREKAPDAITFTDNFEMLRGDGLQTRSVTLVDRRLTKSDSLKPVNIGSDEVLSLNYLGSISSMKLKVKLGSREVVGLIDSGASCCFISSSLAAELNLPCDNSVSRGVQLANGMWHTQKGICRKVDFQLQGIQFTADFRPFELGGVDVILGYDWLKSLGPVWTDWSNLTMQFWQGDSWVCLSGDPSLSLPASLHAILAWRYLGVLVLGSISVLCSNQSPC